MSLEMARPTHQPVAHPDEWNVLGLTCEQLVSRAIPASTMTLLYDGRRDDDGGPDRILPLAGEMTATTRRSNV